MMLSLLCLALQEPLVFERILAPPQGAGIGLAQPVGIIGREGDERLFVTEMPGTVRIVRDGMVEPVPFLSAPPDVVFTGLAGLRAFTFHPDYEQNGFVFIWYDSLDPMGQIELVLSRLTRSGTDPDRVDPTSSLELLRVPQDSRGHGGGGMHFGPDGMLWIAIGDGGLQDDPNCRSQDLGQLLGKLIRIDVDSGATYGIPPDNPFVGVPGARPEIAHAGFRHPWKWSFDRETGDLWIGDVGQWQREEVDFVRAGFLGLNFGWGAMEGSDCHPAAGCPSSVAPCGDPSYTAPIFEYAHDVGCSITGGYVYRGTRVPELRGAYICMDYCTRQAFTLRYDGAQLTEVIGRDVTFLPASVQGVTPSSFGEDGDGELLLLDHGSGSIFRMVRPCGAATTCLGEPNSIGRRSVLRFAGSLDPLANDVRLRVDGVPATSPVLLIYGDESARVPVGNGQLCVGGTIVRAAISFASLGGDVLFPFDVASSGAPGGALPIGSGTTVTFQAWYRDIGGPLGGNSNFSSATTVTFCH